MKQLISKLLEIKDMVICVALLFSFMPVLVPVVI
jgi:hypothetical protein